MPQYSFFYHLTQQKMTKQKLAVLLSTFLFLTSVLVPAIVSADDQIGNLNITGVTDIFYEGWSSAGSNPAAVTFTALTASAGDQDTVLDLTADAWTDTQFIGVLDLTAGDTWSLDVTGPASFSNGGATQTFTPVNIKAATSAHEWAADTLDITTAANPVAETFNMVYDGGSGTEANAKMYYIDAGSSYTYGATHVTGPLNVADTYAFPADNTDASWTDISAQTPFVVNASDEGELGIFGTGINFLLTVPGGTAADSYTGTITYTLV